WQAARRVQSASQQRPLPSVQGFRVALLPRLEYAVATVGEAQHILRPVDAITGKVDRTSEVGPAPPEPLARRGPYNAQAEGSRRGALRPAASATRALDGASPRTERPSWRGCTARTGVRGAAL